MKAKLGSELLLAFNMFLFMFLLSNMLKAQVDSSFFKIKTSTSQNWYGGAPGSGNGTYYIFNIQFSKYATVAFDTVWVNNKPCYINNGDPSANKMHVCKGDSFVLHANAFYPGNRFVGMDSIDEVKENRSLPKIKCNALIQFHVNGVRCFYPVNGTTVLDPIAYP